MERGLEKAKQYLVITGIPRSGTSYLCALLHRYDNCVALNEPLEFSHCLRPPASGDGVMNYLSDLRRRINAGERICNKLHNGAVSEDTRFANDLVEYCPTVASPDFLLAVKATLIVLNHIEKLWLHAPGVRVVASVRNPYDTIASWKTSFPHLQNADVLRVFMRADNQVVEPGLVSDELRLVSELPDVAERRAAWWAYLARLVLRSIPRGLLLLRYDDLVALPLSAIQRVLGDSEAGVLQQPIAPSRPRSRRENLDGADLAAIEKYCLAPAAELGLQMEAAGSVRV